MQPLTNTICILGIVTNKFKIFVDKCYEAGQFSSSNIILKFLDSTLLRHITEFFFVNSSTFLNLLTIVKITRVKIRILLSN